MKKVTLKNRFNFKPAFTLAEVLITLAIIGIVASLTIPTLVKNYQKQQYVTQLKKTYNTLTNGFKQIMAREGVTKLSDTALWSKIRFDSTVSHDQSKFINELSKTIAIQASYTRYSQSFPNSDYGCFYRLASNELDGGSCISAFRPMIILKDGTIIFHYLYKTPTSTTYSIANHMPEYLGFFYIDVNGFKGPNRYGRDLFILNLYNNGSLYGEGSQFDSLFTTGSPTTNSYYWKNAGTDGCKTSNKTAKNAGCAARIMEEGWKMNY